MKFEIELDELMFMRRWMTERELVRVAKEKGYPQPWTLDPLMEKYRWCNVRRMDDRVSRWLLGWYEHHMAGRQGSDERYSALTLTALGRLINWPDTLAKLTPFDGNGNYDMHGVTNTLREVRSSGEKVFTGAYIINGALGGEKIAQVTIKVMIPLLGRADCIDTDSMEKTFSGLEGSPGIQSFMAGQIVADLRHVLPGSWSDRFTWAPLGPGSRRGLARLMPNLGLLGSGPRAQRVGVTAMGIVQDRLREMMKPMFDKRGLELMDIQNCLCEYDKYRRLMKGEGSVRSTYRSHGPLPGVVA